MSGERNHKYFKDSIIKIEEAKVKEPYIILINKNVHH